MALEFLETTLRPAVPADPLSLTPLLHGYFERLFFIQAIGFDRTCPKYITPCYTQAEVRSAVAPLQQRIAELETKIATKR